jgi:exonuclease SbcD
MRLLHTSDWHLGRSFHREDMLSAQGAFVDALVATVRSERVDAVLVAGDIYDRALPAVDAVALCNEALARLACERVRVVLISGNHDSATRLGFGSGLIDSAGIHLRTEPGRCGEPVLLEDRHGVVAIYGIPYLEPDAVRGAWGCDGRGHEAVLGAAMARVRQDLRGRPVGSRSVVLAHAFVAGGRACDSERDISVGGVSVAPAALFADAHYTALGHLHGAQRVGVATAGRDIRYSGSPLPYSFSEEHHRKAMVLVDLDARGVCAVTEVPTPVPRPVSRVIGRLEDLLTEQRWSTYAEHFLQVTLTDATRPREPMERLRTRFPHVLALVFDPHTGASRESGSYTERVRGRSELEIVTGFIHHVRGRPSDRAERALLREALESLRRDGVDPSRGDVLEPADDAAVA